MYVPLLRMDEKQPLLNNENQSQVVDVENAGRKRKNVPRIAFLCSHIIFCLCKTMTLNFHVYALKSNLPFYGTIDPSKSAQLNLASRYQMRVSMTIYKVYVCI